MNIFSYLAFLAVVMCLTMNIYVIKLNNKSRLNWAFVFICLSEALWAFGYIFIYGMETTENLWVYYRIATIGYSILPSLWAYFALVYLKQDYRLKPAMAVFLFLPSLILITRSWTGTMYAEDFIKTPYGYSLVLNTDSIWSYLYLAYNLYFAIPIILLIKKIRKAKTLRVKKQAQIILVAHSFHLFMTYVFNLLFPILGLNLPAFGILMTLISQPLVFIAIVKYQLMRVDKRLIADEIIDNITDSIFILNSDGYIIEINPASKELLNLEDNHLIGKHITHLVFDSGLINEYLHDLSVNLEPISFSDISLMNNEGNPVPVQCYLLPIKDRFGQLLGIALISRKFGIIEQAIKKYRISEREKTVFLLVTQGYSLQQIAEKLFISPGTVKNHLHNIYMKTGVENRMQLYHLLLES